MRDVVLLLVPAWVALSAVTAVASLGTADGRRWHRAQAGLLVATIAVLVGFLLADDHYAQDGRSNWAVYDVELVAVPAVVLLLAGAWWLHRRAGSRAAAAGAPLLALAAAAAALGCVVFTTN